MQRRSLIFVVISVLVVALVYSSFTPFIVFAEPPASGWSKSTNCEEVKEGGVAKVKCCWTEREPGPALVRLRVTYCQTCDSVMTTPNCTPKEKQSVTPPTTGEEIVPGDTGVLEQPPTPPPFDPTAPLQGGVLEQQQTPPTFAPGFLERQQQPPTDQGAAIPTQPATEGAQPAAEQSVPVCQEGLEFNEDLGFCVPEDCPEGQVLDEESGICVLEELEAAEEEPAESQPEEEQPSEESDSGDDANN